MAFFNENDCLFLILSWAPWKKPNVAGDTFKQLSYLKLQTIFCSHTSRVLWFESDHKMKIQCQEKKMHQKLLISFPNDAAINSKGYKLQSSDITFDIPTCLKNGKPSKKILYRGFSWKTEVINNFLSKNTPMFKIYSWSQQYIVMPFTCIYNRLMYERVITVMEWAALVHCWRMLV